jgi:hypothetical protein
VIQAIAHSLEGAKRLVCIGEATKRHECLDVVRDAVKQTWVLDTAAKSALDGRTDQPVRGFMVPERKLEEAEELVNSADVQLRPDRVERRYRGGRRFSRRIHVTHVRGDLRHAYERDAASQSRADLFARRHRSSGELDRSAPPASPKLDDCFLPEDQRKAYPVASLCHACVCFF